MSNKQARCPECDAHVKLPDDVEKHEIVVCDDCGVELEVFAVEPVIELTLAPEEEEDWGE